MQQLPLNIKLDLGVSLDTFFIGKNQILVEFLKRLLKTEQSEFVYLWGLDGSGRSHLLQGVANQWSGDAPMYLPLGEEGLVPEMLQGLAQFPLVIIDDIHHVIGEPKWQEALFHLYNQIKDKQGNLLISSSVSPAHLDIGLKDLQSRLSAMTIFKIHPLSDEDKPILLQQKAAAMGLMLGDEVVQFMLSRSPRDLRFLMDALDTLDQASLVAQRKITVPFVKEVLDL